MTDQDLNIKCAKYVWPDAQIGPFAKPSGVMVIDGNKEGYFFSPSTDANDANLVIDKLIKEGWRLKYVLLRGCIRAYSWSHKGSIYTDAPTMQEANRSVLEKIMTINGSD